VPIPVYAEMSSINPVLLMPAALAARGAALGQAFVGSLTMGAGQFCTNPGLVLAIAGEGLDAFLAPRATAWLWPGAVMLTSGIHAAYAAGVEALAASAGVETLGKGGRRPLWPGRAVRHHRGIPGRPALGHEVFGASSIVVTCADEAELATLLKGLEGQLTATLHMDAADEAMAARLLPILERKAGRILANGWPTGVEVCHAMVHGGPFPATSDARTTSVGSLAIDRFLRPVSYQNLAPAVLPAELTDAARGDGAPRLIDGTLTL
jgi:NADP-dependent aldehyde dehydrogenase